MWMALLLRICFNILPFDTSVAMPAQGAVKLMIVSVAIGMIAKNIEVCRRKGRSASLTDKTITMPTS